MIAHWILQIVVAAVVIYLIRATPFIICSFMKETPAWLKKASDYISPVVIAGLIIYSYSGLKYLTPAPYIAGVVAVVLQLIFRNSLASILVSTGVYMALLRIIG